MTRAQLIECGLGRGAIEHRVRHGRLHVRHPGVYTVGHTAEPPLARELAALLACGDAAILSHRSAAPIWGWKRIAAGSEVDVTLRDRQCRAKVGIRIHRVHRLQDADIRHYANLALTSPARTLLDLAPELSGRELEHAFDDGLVRRLFSRQAVREMLARAPHRPGSSRLRALVDGSRYTTVTRSEAEERFLALARRARLPRAEANIKVGRYTIDFLWREQRLAVEVDGYGFHNTRSSFESDHERDLVLRAAGFDVIRFTFGQIVDEPEFVLVTLGRALAARELSLRARAG